MPANGVNLDALIPREDFAADAGPARGTPMAAINLGLLKEEFFADSLRKPDFQRETSNWTAQKIADLIGAFLEGDLIPAIILWRSGQYVFVIDGAHRLSALLAWIYDDYGDRSRSANFFRNQIPEEQAKLAEQTRRLVEDKYGSYASYLDVTRNKFAPDAVRERVGMINTNSFVAQWVPATDAEGAEKSFFKINQAPTPVDPVEKRILRSRSSAAAIATRAIDKGGSGHKYWDDFEADLQGAIEREAKQVYDALYSPPLGDLPIKSSDVPIGGRGYSSLPFVFDLVQLVNGVGPKDALSADPDGGQTLDYVRRVRTRLERITTVSPGSLGLHPLVYFYTRGGAFQPVAFLAVLQFVERVIRESRLDAFTDVRRDFEAFLLAHKEAFTLIMKRQGAGARSRPALEGFFWQTFEALVAGRTQEEIIDVLSADPRFSFFATPAPVRGDGNSAAFNRTVKSAAFVTELAANGVRCGICCALLHRNSIQTDHKVRKADGGDASHGNAQLSHPYCNSGYKERRASAG